MKYDPQKIVDYLKKKGPSTPTTIGVEVFGINRDLASGTVSRIISKLVVEQKVRRSNKAGYWEAR